MADKLDGVMLVVFTYLDQRLTAHASLPPEKILETSLIHGAVATREEDGGEGGDAGVGSSSSGSKGRRSSMGGSQGMEPVARLLKVRWFASWFVSVCSQPYHALSYSIKLYILLFRFTVSVLFLFFT